MPRLTIEHQRHFRSAGYVKARGVIEAERAHELTMLATSLLGARSGRLENALAHLDLTIDDLKGLLDVAADLIGPTIVALENRHNHVTVDDGSGLRSARSHRDSKGWTQTYLTAVVMLAGAGAEAWTQILPGSHLGPTTEPLNGGGSWLDESSTAVLRDQLLPVAMAPGDALLFDPLLFHAAGRGTPKAPRAMLSLALRAPDELSGSLQTHERLLRGELQYNGQTWWRNV